MTKSHSSLAAGMIALLVASSPALAFSSRTFVSGAGSDSGVCPLSTPCRTFAYALTQTAPSGEIIVLSSAGYGAVTISHAVSIINANYFAGVTVASGNGITVAAGVNDSVTLRGLTIDGGGTTGSNGIVFNSGAALRIEQCEVMNFFGASDTAGNGILLSSPSGYVNISNTKATNNGNAGITTGNPGFSFGGFIAIDKVTSDLNLDGIFLKGTSDAIASITNSFTRQNPANGLWIEGFKTVSVDSLVATENGASGIANYSPNMLLSRSIISGNSTTGISTVGGGSTYSYQNNFINGNTSDLNVALSSASPR